MVAPTCPVITDGPVFVIPVSARTAKAAACPSANGAGPAPRKRSRRCTCSGYKGPYKITCQGIACQILDSVDPGLDRGRIGLRDTTGTGSAAFERDQWDEGHNRA